MMTISYIRPGLLAVWAVGILAVYITQVSGLNVFCGDTESLNLCQNFFTFYFTLYGLLFLAYGAAIAYGRYAIRVTLLLLLALPLLYHAQNFTANELSDPRTYGSEVFITAFYAWAVLMIGMFAGALLFTNHLKQISKIALYLTIIVVVLFIFTGRGSLEQVHVLTGRMLIEQSVESLWAGKLVWLGVVIMGVGIVYSLMYITVRWIEKGDFFQHETGKLLLATGMFFAMVLLPLVSVLPSEWLNKQDIKNAQNYIDRIVPGIKTYQEEHKEYPKIVNNMLPEEDTPRLLQLYEYLTMVTKGGYYLSRPEKYCFVFQNPGREFGYYSLTNERGWKFFSRTASLEEAYLDVCDEAGPQHEKLIAGHLGLQGPDDPVAEMGLEFDEILRPALTMRASQELQKRLDELGKVDPSIYYQQEGGDLMEKTPQLPDNFEFSVDHLREMILRNTEAEKEDAE